MASESKVTDDNEGAVSDPTVPQANEPDHAPKPDDNTALEQSLDAALAADEEALRASESAEQEVAQVTAAIEAAKSDAATTIEAAQGRAKAARDAATSQWQEFYTRLKGRARRSPVRGGPLGNLLTVMLLALSTLLVGCGASPAELANLKAQVRLNEQRLHELEVLDGRIAKGFVTELRSALVEQTVAINTQGEAIVERLSEQSAALDRLLVTRVSSCPCDRGVPGPVEEVPCPEPVEVAPEILPVPSEVEGPMPAEETPGEEASKTKPRRQKPPCLCP